MNNNGYFPNSSYIPSEGTAPPYTNFAPPRREETVADILRQNIDVYASFYMSFPDSIEWRDRVFTGKIKNATRDFFLLYNEEEQKWYILWSIYINYIVFDEKINKFKE